MSTEWKPPAPIECPQCHHKTGVMIARGYPSAAAQAAAASGSIVLGGCIVRKDDPDRECTNCHHQWRTTPAAAPGARPGR